VAASTGLSTSVRSVVSSYGIVSDSESDSESDSGLGSGVGGRREGRRGGRVAEVWPAERIAGARGGRAVEMGVGMAG
jgi:hypothetical protein